VSVVVCRYVAKVCMAVGWRRKKKSRVESVLRSNVAHAREDKREDGRLKSLVLVLRTTTVARYLAYNRPRANSTDIGAT
jgi:hypothetical protein